MIRKIYRTFHQSLNQKQKGLLSKVTFSLLNKPLVKHNTIDSSNKFPNGEKGGLIISADFEMAWAWRYTKTGSNHLAKGRLERDNIPAIINVLERFNIPITFATVGHLFLEKCAQEDHKSMHKIPHFDDHWKFTSGDWYDHDPCSDYKSAPEWYAPDLIQMIIDSPVEHEIGTHTFSHIDFSYKNCPANVADDEIRACIDAAKPYNIKLESIVFPGGTWGNIEVLKKHNFTIYRKRNDFELAYPYRDNHGLLVTTSSGSFEYNLKYGWSPDYYIKRLIKTIDMAVETQTIAHFWFHPSLEPFILKNIFPSVLSYAADKRENGQLWIGTMKNMADHINENNIL